MTYVIEFWKSLMTFFNFLFFFFFKSTPEKVKYLVLWKMNMHMVKKWSEKVVQRTFIKDIHFQTVFSSWGSFKDQLLSNPVQNQFLLRHLGWSSSKWWVRLYPTCTLVVWEILQMKIGRKYRIKTVHTS